MNNDVSLWKGVSSAFPILAEMSNRKSLPIAEREAIGFAFHAIFFAMQPEMLVAFTAYLKSTPRELPQEEEARLKRLLSTPKKRGAGTKKKRG